MADNELQDFSIALGGPLYQLLIKARLLKPPFELIFKRILFFVCLTWIPLLLLSLADHNAIGTHLEIPFLLDFDAHLRFLVALPLLIYSEIIVHAKLKPIIEHFRNCGVVPLEERSKFDEAVASSMKLRNSVMIEVILLIIVFVVGHFVWRKSSMAETSSWYFGAIGGGAQITKAGLWYGLLSLPIFQFVLLRWYFRIFVWARFLWKISKLQLHLIPTHPDNAGGLGFLEEATLPFLPLLLAQGIQVAGVLANRIFYEGQSLLNHRIDIAGVVFFLCGVTLAPFLTFTSRLIELKKKSLRGYGVLAYQYVEDFEHKWISGQTKKKDELLGSADIQSLADLANSYQVIKSMRFVPLSRKSILQVILTILAPISLLVFTLIPIEQLMDSVFKLIF